MREALDSLAARYALPTGAADRLAALLTALAGEPDPPTTRRSPEEALCAHVADGLSGLEVDELAGAARVADLGSGAGFPGLVLATARPEAQLDLVESAARKCAVIDRLIRAAAIENARSVRARVEEWASLPAQAGGGAGGYDVVTARALGSLALLEEYAAPLLREGGVLVAWKGERDPAEEAAGTAAARALGLRPEGVLAVVPFPGARHRHLHVIRKVAATPTGFPRRPGMARKRPLG